MIEHFLGVPLHFRENTSVAISWNAIPEAENVQSVPPPFLRPMSEESITQARQLFSSPIFARERNSCLVVESKTTPVNVALATPTPSLIPGSSGSYTPTQALATSKQCMNLPVFQTRNPIFSSISKHQNKYDNISQCVIHFQYI